MLRDLTIKNYRCFQEFRVDGLARVNLIVGMNNSGKTSLLEAVYLLVGQGDPWRLVELLYRRGETFEPPKHPVSDKVAVSTLTPGYQISHLFHGHRFEFERAIRFLSRADSPLMLEVRLHPPVDHSYPQLVLSFEGHGEGGRTELPVYDSDVIEAPSFRSTPAPHHFLTPSHLSVQQLAEFWDQIILTSKEDDVVRALQILEPAVDRISFISHRSANSGALLRLRGRRDPIPLGSMGDGIRRILTLAASTIMAENGVLLVDEIDTGLHHETQTGVWRLLIETAHQLNVQIFATTHSWDCVRAFQEALARWTDSSAGILFRLSQRDQDQGITPVMYTADELAVAVREDIEVR